jgi:hypothetical protein
VKRDEPLFEHRLSSAGPRHLGAGESGQRRENPLRERVSVSQGAQGRQDSNLQPPVLETGALPIELRPSAVRSSGSVSAPRRGYASGVTDQPYDEREDERDAESASIHEEEPEDPLLEEVERSDDPDSLDGR